MRCPFYEEEIYDSVVAQIFCENPEVTAQAHKGEDVRCPFGAEYECDIPIHLKNLGNKNINKQAEEGQK